MVPKVCILTYGKLNEILREEIGRYEGPAQMQVYEILMGENVELPREAADADVYVSSGYNAAMLRRKTDRPVITMEASISDMLMALERSVRYDPRPLMVFFGQESRDLETFRSILSCRVKQSCYQTPDDLEEIILRHVREGGRCVVGTALACQCAEKHGLRSVYLYPRESVGAYLTLAADTAAALHKETAKNRQLSAIVNYSSSGILLTDAAGVITVSNPVAQAYFGHGRPGLVGLHIHTLFTPEELGDVFGAKMATLNLVCTEGDARYLVNAVPVVVKNQLSSMLFTITDAETIRSAEKRIARTVREKGFVARHHFEQYRSRNEKFRRLIQNAMRFSQTDEIIVIHGETGTGKEILAQSIHNNSLRATAPFVPINCSALSENLLESELFGYEEGAFTGARRGGKEGVFEMARHGTILLDEVGEIRPAIQAKLLRVIQEKQIMRVGGTRLTPIDSRIVAATNRRLWELVQAGAFREDLYYRLNVLELYIPPLRERPEDITPLFFQFMEARASEAARVLAPYEKELAQILGSYSWPGNIRELENLCVMLSATVGEDERAAHILGVVEDVIGDRREKLTYKCAPRAPEPAAGPAAERVRILEALRRAGGNQTQAAKLLGISRVTLWRKLREQGEEGGI